MFGNQHALKHVIVNFTFRAGNLETTIAPFPNPKENVYFKISQAAWTSNLQPDSQLGTAS